MVCQQNGTHSIQVSETGDGTGGGRKKVKSVGQRTDKGAADTGPDQMGLTGKAWFVSKMQHITHVRMGGCKTGDNLPLLPGTVVSNMQHVLNLSPLCSRCS